MLKDSGSPARPVVSVGDGFLVSLVRSMLSKRLEVFLHWRKDLLACMAIGSSGWRVNTSWKPMKDLVRQLGA